MSTYFYLCLLICAAVPTGWITQSTLRVEAGETITIDVSRQKMLVDNWIMEDNSTIIISDEIEGWEINASRATFGVGCRILGQGRDGTSATHSAAHGGSGRECVDGGHGGNGGHGESGAKGKNLTISMGLVKVSDLYINVSGGDGGHGGNAANGGKGGRASCGRVCGGQEGGNGGKGGNAGHGGSGGNVVVKYWIVGDEGISMGSDQGLRAFTEGGVPGVVGLGGSGGAGGDGKRCPPFNSVRRSGGSAGYGGSNGTAGATGSDGRILFSILPSPSTR